MYIAVCECSFELDEYGHWNAKNVYPGINVVYSHYMRCEPLIVHGQILISH